MEQETCKPGLVKASRLLLAACVLSVFAACGSRSTSGTGEGVAQADVPGSDLSRTFDAGLPELVGEVRAEAFTDMARPVEVTGQDTIDAPDVCLLECADKECSDDGCGGSCGECDDGDVCNGVETCQEGSCLPGAPLDCDDDKPCTVDECDSQAGCQHVEHDGPCDDGDLCTDGDQCVAGACEPGKPVVCDDGEPCTSDMCKQETGLCESVVALDLPECGVTICWGQTQADADHACKDENVCTLDSCFFANGFVPLPVDSEPPVESLSDLPVGIGVCKHEDKLVAGFCDDGDLCTTDSCDPELGCVFECNELCDCPPSGWYEDCDDGNPCTKLIWTGWYSCTFLPIECNDNDLCTLDYCGPSSPDDEAPCVFEPIDNCGE